MCVWWWAMLSAIQLSSQIDRKWRKKDSPKNKQKTKRSKRRKNPNGIFQCKHTANERITHTPRIHTRQGLHPPHKRWSTEHMYHRLECKTHCGKNRCLVPSSTSLLYQWQTAHCSARMVILHSPKHRQKPKVCTLCSQPVVSRTVEIRFARAFEVLEFSFYEIKTFKCFRKKWNGKFWTFKKKTVFLFWFLFWQKLNFHFRWKRLVQKYLYFLLDFIWNESASHMHLTCNKQFSKWTH